MNHNNNELDDFSDVWPADGWTAPTIKEDVVGAVLFFVFVLVVTALLAALS